MSLAVKDGLVLTGAEKDQLLSWRESTVAETAILSPPKAGGSKTDIKPDPDDRVSMASVVEAISIQERFIAVGCKNQHIFILSKKSIKTIINTYNIGELRPDSQCASIRSVDFADEEGTKMLVGTLASEIYEVQFDSGVYKEGTRKPNNVEVRMQGHYSPNNHWTNEVWGLCVDSKSNKFFTCSDDATVRCWDADKRMMMSLDSLNMGPKK